MQNKPKQPKPVAKKPRRFIKIAIICGVILMAIVVVDIFTFIGGNTHLYIKWVQCGERPYVVDAMPFASISFYKQSPVFALFRQHKVYFCSPLEAEKAGVSASPSSREFPHLKEQGLPPPPWPPRLPK